MASVDPRIDAKIDGAAPFAQPILRHLRMLVHDSVPDVEETLKWGMPHFQYKGKILCHMASFKAHVAFGFWHHVEILGTARDGEAMGSFGRITKLSDLPDDKKIVAYLLEAVRLRDIDAPVAAYANKSEKPELPLPDDLAQMLGKAKGAMSNWDKFPPSHRREYIEWVTDAKRDETRAKRISQTVDWVVEGKDRNWKYR